jgi:hypothetical protein
MYFPGPMRLSLPGLRQTRPAMIAISAHQSAKGDSPMFFSLSDRCERIDGPRFSCF